MSTFTRLSEAFRRLASTSSVRLVRNDDLTRERHHGGPIAGLTDRAGKFADEVEQRAIAFERDAGL